MKPMKRLGIIILYFFVFYWFFILASDWGFRNGYDEAVRDWQMMNGPEVGPEEYRSFYK